MIPLPTAADNHQMANARIWTTGGAGWLIVEKDASPESIALRITDLMENPTILQRAAKCAKDMNPEINADEALAKAVIEKLKELR